MEGQMVDNNKARRRTAAGGAGSTLAFVAFTVAACSGMGPTSASAADVAEVLQFCSNCHGPDGRSASSKFPRLAGQHKDYIIAQLQDFRNDTRTAPHAQNYLEYLTMWGLVAHLNDASIDAIAAFYASQAPVAGEPAASPEIAAGRRLYTEGVPSDSVPACISCHGPRAEGNGPVPRLAGQYQDYLARQLEAFASWARQNITMHAESMNLTPEQISAVTAYLATL
jgi:cytochrome c553